MYSKHYLKHRIFKYLHHEFNKRKHALPPYQTGLLRPDNSRDKKEEYREIKEGITANRYLLKDEKTKYRLNENVTDKSKEYFIDDYNNGNFPFMPKEYKYLYLAVGYAKNRDTAIVKITGFSFKPEMIRANLYAFWMIVFHLGEVTEIKLKDDKSK